MLDDLDRTLRALLIEELPRVIEKIEPDGFDIRFDVPNRELKARLSKPTINLYLFNIQENRSLRGQTWEQRRVNGSVATRRPPVRLDCSYMLTAWSNEIEDEHRLLTGATRVLFRNPTLPSNILQGSLARDECSITTEVAQPESFKDVVDIWSVLDNDLRPSVRVTVTVPLEVDMEYLTPPVRDVDMRGPSPDYVPPSDKPVRLEGKVVRGGRPVPDARIRIDRSSGITDADGAYALRGVKPGTHTAMVVDADSVFCTVDVVVPGDGLIELPVASEQEPPVRAASGTKATARKIEDGRNRLKEK